MKSNTLLMLGGLAVVAAGAALFVLNRERSGGESHASSGTAILPDLRASLNDASKVVIEGGGETLTLERVDGRWGMSDKGHYPVDVDKVKALVVGLSELTLIEEKTSNPANFAKLDVQDPGDKDVPSKRVEVFGPGDKVLADVIVGRTIYGRAPGQGSLFVRQHAGGPALEVRGSLAVDNVPTNWLDRQVAKLERKRVHQVVITHPTGEVVTIQRDSPDLTDFQVADLPEGRELAWAGVAGGVAGALEYLNLEDVKPAGSTPFDEAAAVSTRFVTFDGLVLNVKTLEKDGQTLLTASASFDADARVETPPGPPPPSEDGAEPPADTPPPTPPGKTPEEVQKEADALNARLSQWVYVVPGYAGTNLRKKLEDLLKQPEAAAPADEPAGDPMQPFLDETTGVESQVPLPTDPAAPSNEPPPPPDEGGGR